MQLVEFLGPAELQRRWQLVTEDEELAHYQGRAELDAYGEVSLTPPPSLVHQRIANELAGQIQAQLGGRAIVECPVLVDGVLVADAAWLSGGRAAQMTSPAAERPEIVLEVSSPRNTKSGLRSKAARFLAHGVEEVVLVELDGTICFITNAGESSSSRFGLKLALPPNSYPLRGP
jgi:Uma2 family endonuclease